MKINSIIFSIFFLLEIALLVLCIPTNGVNISMDINSSVEAENKVINGDFENSNKFDAWEQVSWPFPGLANIVTVYEGKRHACLQATSSEQRIGYRQKITNLEKGDWNLNFVIKHDGGTHYQAGFTIYFYNTNQTYLGRTYWIVSNQAGGVNDSENLYFDIRKKTEFNWYVVNVNLTDSMFRPDAAKNLTIIDSLEVFLHVYGVSGSGAGVKVSYDEISFVIDTSPNETSEGSQTSGIPILSPSLEIEITLFSMIVTTILLLKVRRKS